MLRGRHSWVLRYGVAAIASLVALFLTQALWLRIQPALYPFFLAAVMLSSWFGGLGPGLVSTALGAFLSEHFFLTPDESSGAILSDLGRVSYFVSVAVLISVLNARLRYKQRRAEANTLELQCNQALLLQSQRTLQQSEERYRLLVEGVTDYAIFILSPQGCIQSWTFGAERILGYQEAEAIGQPFSILFTEDAIQHGIPEKVLREASQGFSKETRWHIRKDKTCFWAHCVITALWDEAGNLRGYSKIMQDITARRKAEEERNQFLEREQLARQEAESANRAKDEFLAILSHELRTPLAAITGWVEMLRSGKLDTTKTKIALETIERNATLQTQLVEDLLDISRIIRGDLWLDNEPVDLFEVIQEAIEIIQPRLEEKHIRFDFRVDLLPKSFIDEDSNQTGLTSVLVMGDSERLRQIVLNLLANAIKFTPEGGEVIVSLSVVSPRGLDYKPFNNSVDVNTRCVVQLQVKDTGIGIPADFLPHVFDRFRQADSTNTRSYKGLGLGLAIARYLVERQGGTIEADSPGVEQGATFTVKLPLLERTEKSDRLTSYSNVPFEIQLDGLSILIVDDEADTRTWLTNLFEMQRARVVAVSSVDEAIRQLDQLSPDIVISDIAMPGKDGYVLIKEVQQYERLFQRAIPAIALTAHASLKDIEKTRAAGFWQHLAKPIKAEDLITVITRLLKQ
jgi:PAS domain S-box-containing protein